MEVSNTLSGGRTSASLLPLTIYSSQNRLSYTFGGGQKPILWTSTSIQHVWLWSKQTPNFYKISHAWSKTNSPNYTWQWSKRSFLTSIGRGHANFSKPPTRLVTEQSPIQGSKRTIHKVLTYFTVHACWQSLWTSTTRFLVGGGQNGLSVLLQSLHHVYTKQTLQTSTKPSARLYKTDSPNFYKSLTCKAAVKTDIPNFYRLGDGHNGLSELFGGGKHSPNFYESPTRMAAVLSKVLKTNSSSFYKPPKRLVAVKTESSTSGLSKLLLASYTLGVGLNGLFKRERLSSPGLKRFTLS